jgi:RHS repeat-associated protein
LDGNLTSDGRWNYTWDAENRLVALVANTAVGPQQSIKFEYDSKSRRIGKKVWNNLTFNGTPALEQKFLYDGWNLIGVLNSLFALQASFYWGSDLSGTIQGAGGVGSLLEINDAVNGVHFVGYDGNGNVSVLAKGSDGSVSVRYEYGPFGEVIRATGPMAKANPFRFSTKYQDDETDFLYYGYRYCNASTGRWLSRDPAEENGGENSSVFVSNEPLNETDLLGLCGGGGDTTPKCGVDKISMRLLQWQLNPAKGVAQANVALLIKFTHDAAHDSSACLVVPRVKVLLTIDSKRIPKNEQTGLPYDGNWHTDTAPWTEADDLYLVGQHTFHRGLNDNLKGNAEASAFFPRFGINMDDWDYVAGDAPGFGGGVTTGRVLDRKWHQKVIIIDVNNKQKIAEEDLSPMKITGTYPNVSFTPPVPK